MAVLMKKQGLFAGWFWVGMFHSERGNCQYHYLEQVSKVLTQMSMIKECHTQHYKIPKDQFFLQTNTEITIYEIKCS